MSKLYLNEVPLDLLLKYYTKESKEDGENTLATEQVKNSEGNVLYIKPSSVENISVADLTKLKDSDNTVKIIVSSTTTTTVATSYITFISDGTTVTATASEDDKDLTGYTSYAFSNLTSFENVEAYYEDGSSTIILKIINLPVLVPKLTADGKTLYTNEYGFLTTSPSADSSANFLNHQKAIRSLYYGITENSGWMYEFSPSSVGILEYSKNKHTLATYIQYTKTQTLYTSNPDASKTWSASNISPEIISYEKYSSAKNSVDNAGTILASSINKNPIYLDSLEDIPNYEIRVDSSISDPIAADIEFSLYSANSNSLDPLTLSYALNSTFNANLKLVRRRVALNGSNYIISNNNTLQYSVSMPNYLNRPGESTVFDLDTNSPYIIIPLFINEATVQNFINQIGTSVSISLNKSRIVYKGEVNSTSLDTYIDFGTFKANLYTKSELGVIADLYTENSADNIIFAKIEFDDKVSRSYLSKTYLANLKYMTENTTPTTVSTTTTYSNRNISTLNDALDISTSKIRIKIKSGNQYITSVSDQVDGNGNIINSPIVVSRLPKQLFKFNSSLAIESSYKANILENTYETIENQFKYIDPSIQTLYIKTEFQYTNYTSETVLALVGSSIKESLKEFVIRMSTAGLYDKLDNSILRGDIVDDNLVFNQRKEALRLDLISILESSNETVDYSALDQTTSYFFSSMYNYSLGLSSLISKTNSVNMEDFANVNINPLESTDIPSRIIVGLTNIEDYNAINQIDNTYYKGDSRPLLQRLAEAEKYPIESVYRQYNTTVLKDTSDKLISVDNNTNKLRGNRISIIKENSNYKNYQAVKSAFIENELSYLETVTSDNIGKNGNTYTNYYDNDLFVISKYMDKLDALSLFLSSNSASSTSYKEIFSQGEYESEETMLTEILTSLFEKKTVDSVDMQKEVIDG